MPNYLIALIPIVLIALWFGLAVVDAGKIKSPRNLCRLRGKLPGSATWTVLIFALFCGVLALFLFWLGYSEATKEEVYINLSTSLGSIAITVLVIDQLNRWRIASERKREIMEQMGSPVNGAALEAVRLARKNGWLEDGSLKGANLVGADLQRAFLWSADLRGALLPYAKLQYANLQKANLQGADLLRANLQSGHFAEANLQGAKLREAKLQNAYLRAVNLQDVDLLRADLQHANLWEANLQGANLTEANLQGANLTEANLQGADLRGANLQGVNLMDANLQGAYLMDADLQGATLWGTKNRKTTWPDGIDPVAAGAILVDADPGQSEAELPA